MKMLIGLFVLVLSTASFASTTDSETFVYDGSQNSAELVLRAEKFRTEYRTENYNTTCSRTVTDWQTVCTSGGTYTTCTQTPSGRVCRTHHTPRQCHQRPVYRTVFYACTQTRTVSYEVKDYDVEARVIVDVTKASEAVASEKITATLRGETLSYSASGSKKFFVLKKKEDVRATVNGGTKVLDAVLAVELVEASEILKAVALDNISVSNNIVNVNAAAQDLKNVSLSLKIEKKKLFGSNPVLIDRELAASEVTVNGNSAGIDLSKLGVDLNDGKFEITVKAAVKLNGALLNSSQFGEALTSSKTVVFKN